MPQTRLIVGAMSGTSADGVDVALVRISGKGAPVTSASVVAHHHRAYEPITRAAIFSMRQGGQTSLRDLAELARAVTLTYAAAVNELLVATSVTAQEIAAVAAHGQTLFHDPPLTIQWLDPSLLAAEVGCAVVSDFRRADCAAGGQGAPLVPFADHVLFTDEHKTRVLLNIGGIANLTYLPAGATLENIIAFDTGPGNCISDALMREMHPTGPGFDDNGALASHGKPDEQIVLRVLANDYFKRPPPKSTDGPGMIDLFQEAVSDPMPVSRLPAHLATACLISATAIVRSMRDFLPHFPDEVIASGGGTRNAVIMNFLRAQLGGVPLRTTEELGLKSDAKEALAFALLGAATLDNVPSNVPSVTGASRPVVLGSITPKP